MIRATKFSIIHMIVLAILCGGAGYFAGKRFGFSEGVTKTSDQYNLWVTSLMFPDPEIQLRSILLIPNNGMIQKPHCDAPSAPYLRLARRPDADNRTAHIEDASSIDAWIARIPTEAGMPQPYAAAVIGCALRPKVSHSRHNESP